MQKEYIGDGVYAEVDEFGNVVLTTEDGISIHNRIVLEGPVLAALFAWLKRTAPEAFKRLTEQ